MTSSSVLARLGVPIATLALVALSVAHCAPAPVHPQPATEGSGAHTPRQRPSEHGMQHVFERVQPDAVRCLRPGDNVRVSGNFDGPSGDFHVNRIENSSGPLPYAVETCVRVAAERARVHPFLDPVTAFAYTFSLPGNTTVGSTPGSASYVAPIGSGNMSINAGPSPVDLIRRDADALQRCYEQACERDHTVAGSVELHLTLDARGAVTRLTSRVDTTHEDPTLMDLVARCIESHIRLIAFGPQTSPNVEIVVPLQFNPGGVPIE